MKTLMIIMSLLASSFELRPEIEVEAYDLRGKGYTDKQVGAIAKEQSKAKMVLLVLADTTNKKYQRTVLDVVKIELWNGRKNIVVLFADRDNVQTATFLTVKEKMSEPITEKNDPNGYELSIAIQTGYDKFYKTK